jgi:hypothetical protein
MYDYGKDDDYQQSRDHRRDTEEIMIRAAEILGAMYLAAWFFRKMWHHPVAALMFLGLSALAVETTYWIPVHDWEFWPVAFCAAVAFTRTVRRE